MHCVRYGTSLKWTLYLIFVFHIAARVSADIYITNATTYIYAKNHLDQFIYSHWNNDEEAIALLQSETKHVAYVIMSQIIPICQFELVNLRPYFNDFSLAFCQNTCFNISIWSASFIYSQ